MRPLETPLPAPERVLDGRNGSGPRVENAKAGRNDPCPCGSGKKFKHCCQINDARSESSGRASRRRATTPTQRSRLQALYFEARKHWEAGRWAESIPTFREIARLDPDNPDAHHDLGGVLFRCGRLAEAAASLLRAVELRPSYESALRNLVNCLEPEGRESEALVYCRKLSRIARDPIDRRYYLAKVLATEGDRQEAEKELRRVLLAAARHKGALLLLATLLSEGGMLQEAARHLATLVESEPSAFEPLARAKRMTDEDRPLIDRMRSMAERPDLSVKERICVHFGLGKAFDDLGEYADAMQHFEEGNRLRSMSNRLDRANLVAHYDGMIANFEAEALSRAGQAIARPDSGNERLPVFIVGMPRSGTTLVEQILSSHPAVAAAGELTFWNNRVDGWRASGNGSVGSAQIADAGEDYRALLRTIGPEAQVVTDKAPGNFVHLWLIRLALPEARIIHCRRHPVDTCLSIFFTNFWKRHEYAADRGDLVFYYRQYARLMGHWRNTLPADRFTEVDYEALIADREEETRRLVAFCGLEWTDACLAPEHNTRTVKTASVWQARQPVYKTSVGRWRRYEPWLGELRELLPDGEGDRTR